MTPCSETAANVSADTALETPSPQSHTRQKPSLPTPAYSASPETAAASRNNRVFEQNPDVISTPHVTDLTPSKTKIVVNIPPLPSGSQQGDYQELPESPKRRKLNNEVQSERVALHVRAQKEEADTEIVRFQDFLLEIFAAEDDLAPDTSATRNVEDSGFFEAFEESEDSSILLTTKIHSKLQNAIKKLVSWKRFNDVPAEYVKRLQKLCEPALSPVQIIDLKVDDTTDQVEQWRGRVKAAENGATSACTVIWTVLGSLHDKELCPEDVIQYLPNMLTNIFENCLIPIVEARSGGRSAEMFRYASESKEVLTRLLHQGRKLLDLVATLCVQMDGAESAINATEYLASKLIFVENAHSEKESILGLQPFETVRRTAMEALAKIFARFSDQRSFILDEILISLQKLPSTTRAARQYKLGENINIQLLTALVMQLVQTTASAPTDQRGPRAANLLTHELRDGSSESVGDEDENMTLVNGADGENKDENRPTVILLNEETTALHSNGAKSAQYIIGYLVQRAMTSTKTGEEPYRNLLDLFTQDLISVLGLPEWPASELLLRVLAISFISITKDDKCTGTAKNMALEQLGWMASAISTLRVNLSTLVRSVHGSGSDVAHDLEQFAEDQLRGGVRAEDLIAADGPYRIVLDHLQSRATNDWQLVSAHRYYLVQWAKVVCSTFKLDELDPEDDDFDPAIERLSEILLVMLTEPVLMSPTGFSNITPAQARLAYGLTLLNMGFSRLFEPIVILLLGSITSDQVKIRSKSIKSITSMLETDPSLLDRDPNILRVIFRSSSDQSSMVRDSALTLIAKCMALKPALEEEACKIILACSSDPMVGVRKRCIGLLENIYVRDSRTDLKVAISKALLDRTSDLEDSVSGLARKTLRELWIVSLLPQVVSRDDSAKTNVAIEKLTTSIVQTVSQAPQDLLPALQAFLGWEFKTSAKESVASAELCERIVANLFELVVNAPEAQDVNFKATKDGNRAYREGLLSTLVAFAKAKAKLVIPEQLVALQPYIGDLNSGEDLTFFRYVVKIYRCVLPSLSSTQEKLLKDIQDSLFRTISKLARGELNEVMACLWTIDGVLQNTVRIVRLTISVLKGIRQVKLPPRDNAADEQSQQYQAALNRIKSYVRIAGSVGKYCDLDKHHVSFREVDPLWKDQSVASLMADLISPYTIPGTELSLRTVALESLGAISQSWPGQFNKDTVRTAFNRVFAEQSDQLQAVVLKSFAEFFGIREGAAEVAVETDKAEQEQDLGRLGGSLKASDHDGAAALIAQHYVDSMIHIAMTRRDNNALMAIKVLASINRQGLIHPKKSAGVLVSLETSTDLVTADIAYESHKMMHQQHETMFEREYSRAVQEAFVYQKNVLHDSAGATCRPYKAKLAKLFEIVEASNAKYVKKFVGNLVARANFELAKLDISSGVPEHLLFVRFLVHNLAYVDYGRIDELLHTILCLESLVGKAGADVAQAIETQVIGTNITTPIAMPDETVDELQAGPITQPMAPQQPSIDSSVLKGLVTASMILTLLWEARTHLRRQYGITQDVRQLTGKTAETKDLAKVPSKAHGVTGDRFWDNVTTIMSSLDSTETMIERCHSFANLMNIDDEVKVAAADDDMREALSTSLGPDDENSTFRMSGAGSRPGKRKNTASAGGTPKKKRGRPSLKGRRKSSMKSDDDEDGDWE